MPGGDEGVFLAVLPMLFEMLLHISCYGIWLERDAWSCIELMQLEEELAKLKKKKTGLIFKLFIQKKNIDLTHIIDRGYILWSLCYHLNAGPFPPQHTWKHCIETGVMQLQQ